MEKAFLDTNIVIDIAYRNQSKSKMLDGKLIYISPLSIHILCYVKQCSLPDKYLEKFVEQFYIESFTENLLRLALQGPTDDLEDNIHLQTALKANCDYFVTDDKELLKMKFFGKVKIVSSL